MKRMLREPLLHFLLIGGALFALHATLNRVRPPSVSSARIEITKGDADQLRQAWQMQWKRPPTTDELDGLMAGEIRERILSREAMKLGPGSGRSHRASSARTEARILAARCRRRCGSQRKMSWLLTS